MGERANLTAKKPEAKTVNSVSHVRQTGVSRSADSPVDQILFLQRTIGNQAVQRLIKSGNLQGKLRVGQPGDRYEQEAERMADTVMNKPEPQNLRIEGGPVQTQQVHSTSEDDIHRQSEEQEEEEPVQLIHQTDAEQYIQRQEQEEEEEEEPLQLSQEIDTGQYLQKQEQEEEELVQTKAPDTSPDTGPDLQNQLAQSRGSGSSLSEHTSAFMESRFGTDFSDVKVHHDNQASEMSKALNAQAFTSGKDIYFGAGRYSPGTTSGDKLLAHELTHVVQQRSSSVAQGFSRSLSRSSTEKNDVIYRQQAALSATEGKTTSKSAEDIAPGEIDLKGKSDFIPEGAIADYFTTRKTGKVKVRFGNMAKGVIKVKKSVDKYQIPKNESIPLTHPVFAGAPEFKPSLKLFTSGTGIKGYIGIGKGRSDQDLVSALRKAPDIFGLVGFDISKVPKITNELEGGSLYLGINNATIELGGAFTGKFSLGAVNENIKTFEGNAKIQNIPKLGSAEMELKRSKEGDITGKVTLDTQIKNVTGNFIIIWEKGVISGEGKVGYQGEKLSGSVTLIIMEKSQAEQLEQEKKAPEGKVPASRPKAGKARRVNYVVFGEGDLTFTFTEWLAGSAHVIIDHKGFLTVIGKITPSKEIELFPQKDYNKKLFKVEARASYGIPVVGNIFIFANIGMDAFANIGPGKLYNITVEGTYSTDPKKAQSFSIRGSLNISAGAGLRLRGEAGAGLEILAHDIKAGAGISGIAGIRGYAEATPVIGYREKAKEGEDKKGEFFIRGELEIAAQPFLGLAGDVFVEIDAPWWSPVPDKRWTWPLVNKEWPIGGSLGMKASVDYVFGSNVPPAVEIKPAEFSADKFMTDLYSDKAKSKSGGEKEQKGKWQEKNAKTAEPPKAGKKGGAQVGKVPELPPAKSKVKPGGAKKAKKPVDPNAKTAEGKSVKEYQEEASKTGKKPVGKEPKKGAGKEEVAEKDPAKRVHDEQLQKGLTALDAVTKRYAEEGATKEEVKAGVNSVRRKFKVFKSIKVVDGKKTWDYWYIASEEEKKEGTLKATKDMSKPDGSRNNPYWIKWHKRSTDRYPRIKIRPEPDADLVTVAPTERKSITIEVPTGEAKETSFALKIRLENLERELRDRKDLRGKYDENILKDVQERLTEANEELARLKELDLAEKRGKVLPQKWKVSKLKNEVRDIERTLEKIAHIPELKSQIQNVRDELEISNKEIVKGGSTIKLSETIGVESNCQILTKDTTVGPRHKSPERRKEREFKDFMANAGHNLKEHDESPDHVTELSLSGLDDFKNLWPLPANENIIPNQKINLETGKQAGVGFEETGEKGKNINTDLKNFKGKYFIVKGFQK